MKKALKLITLLGVIAIASNVYAGGGLGAMCMLFPNYPHCQR